MKVVPFRAAHLNDLRLQSAQAYFSSQILQPGYGEMLERDSIAFTGVDANGQVVAIAGCAERWDGHATAWALMSCDAGPHLRFVMRALKGFLDNIAPWKRIEASVDVGFPAGDRMLKLLGFEYEGLARAYSPIGGDCHIYARIRP
jgi:hypothetical protein